MSSIGNVSINDCVQELNHAVKSVRKNSIFFTEKDIFGPAANKDLIGRVNNIVRQQVIEAKAHHLILTSFNKSTPEYKTAAKAFKKDVSDLQTLIKAIGPYCKSHIFDYQTSKEIREILDSIQEKKLHSKDAVLSSLPKVMAEYQNASDEVMLYTDFQEENGKATPKLKHISQQMLKIQKDIVDARKKIDTQIKKTQSKVRLWTALTAISGIILAAATVALTVLFGPIVLLGFPVAAALVSGLATRIKLSQRDLTYLKKEYSSVCDREKTDLRGLEEKFNQFKSYKIEQVIDEVN
jgi:transcription termination factor NusB